MAIQFKRGYESNRTQYTPIEGEILIIDFDTDKPKIYVGDGTTPGGKLSSTKLTQLQEANIASITAADAGKIVSINNVGQIILSDLATLSPQTIPTLDQVLVSGNTSTEEISVGKVTATGFTLGYNEETIDGSLRFNSPNVEVRYNNNWVPLNVVTFLELSDTPSSYSNNANNVIKVNATETGIEFFTLPAVALSGSYNDLLNLPTFSTIATSGSYNDLLNKPSIPSDLNELTDNSNLLTGQLPNLSTVACTGSYTDLINTPTIPTDVGDLTDTGNVIGSSNFSGNYNDLTNKPTVPTDINELSDNSSLLTTDWTQITNKPNFASVSCTANYNDLNNLPTIPLDISDLTDSTNLICSNIFSGCYCDLINPPTDISEFTDNTSLLDVEWTNILNKPNFSVVSISGNYNDLINIPTIPSDISDLTDTTNLLTSFSGNYNDLTNKPTIPTDINDLSDNSDLLLTNTDIDNRLGQNCLNQLFDVNDIAKQDNYVLTWNNSAQQWLACNILDFNSCFSSKDTDDLAEGSTNLYYNDSRARSAISVSCLGGIGDSDLCYNAITGVLSFTGPSALDIRSQLSICNFSGDGTLSYSSLNGVMCLVGPTATDYRSAFCASSDLTYNASTGEFSVTMYKSTDFDNDFGSKSTTDLSEGSNLYFTNNRARQSICVTGAGSYDPSTGSINICGGVTDVNSLTGSVTLDTDNINEGNNLYFTDARARLAFCSSGDINYDNTTGEFSLVSLQDFDSCFAAKRTCDLDECFDLYYTPQRARLALCGGTGVSYNNVSGEFSIGQSVGTTDNVTFNNITFTSLTGTINAVGNDKEIQFNNAGNLGSNSNLCWDNLTNTLYSHNLNLSGTCNFISSPYGDLVVSSTSTTIINNSNISSFLVCGGAKFCSQVIANITGTVSDVSNHNSDSIAEGSTNLYFTDARARNSICVSGSGSYDSNTGEIIVTGGVTSVNGCSGAVCLYTGDIPEGVNCYFTESRARASLCGANDVNYNSTTGEISVVTYKTQNFGIDFAAKTTTDLTEGSNLYYTNNRSRNSISVTGAGTYDVNTGVIDICGGVTSVNGLTGAINLTTDQVTEGANLYYTDSRARTSICATGGVLSYDNLTGALDLSFTGTTCFGTIIADYVCVNCEITCQAFGPMVFESANDIRFDATLQTQVMNTACDSFVVMGGAKVCGDLTVDGTLYANNTCFATPSDCRLKTNYCNIENSLDLVKLIRPLYFDWCNTGCHDIGVIAQELNTVLPEAVKEMHHKELGCAFAVDYTKIVPLLTQAVIDLTCEIKDLKKCMNGLM